MSTDADVPKLRIHSSMDLEQAMAEVRNYLEAAKNAALKSQAAQGAPASAAFGTQDAIITRLWSIAGRLGGHTDLNSKLGLPGTLLKRTVRKIIGWYSRPAYEFDHVLLESLYQIRQDMIGLQQQVTALRQELASAIPALPPVAQSADGSALMGSSESEAALTPALEEKARRGRPLTIS